MKCHLLHSFPQRLEATYTVEGETGHWIEILCLAPSSHVSLGELPSLTFGFLIYKMGIIIVIPALVRSISRLSEVSQEVQGEYSVHCLAQSNNCSLLLLFY